MATEDRVEDCGMVDASTDDEQEDEEEWTQEGRTDGAGLVDRIWAPLPKSSRLVAVWCSQDTLQYGTWLSRARLVKAVDPRAVVESKGAQAASQRSGIRFGGET